MLRANLVGLPTGVINIGLFLGGVWVLAMLGFGRAPAFLKRAAAAIPIFLLVFGLTALWSDVRLLMPLYTLVVPLALAYVASVVPGKSDVAVRRQMIAGKRHRDGTAAGIK